MLKFFRKIRKQLLRENKISRYLLYAIGEILLVVIGILIALQINNANESRKAYNDEVQLYSLLLQDLNSQHRDTYFNINSIKSDQDRHYDLYNDTKGEAQFESSGRYNPLQWIFPYHLSITEKYAESLTTIKNDNIRDLLKSYISREKATKDAYDEWNELKEQRLRPFFNKYGIHNTEGVFKLRSYDFYSMSTVNLINYSKLKEQFGTIELDELLFDLRFKTSWVYSKLVELNVSNNKLEQTLIAELALAKKSERIVRIPRKYIPELLSEGKTIDEIIETIKKEDKNEPIYFISEYEINSLGYNLMNQGKDADALKLFKLNTELYPKSSNTYDSYGECLLKIGDTENAIKAYKKALELNPDNVNAEKVISNIKYQ